MWPVLVQSLPTLLALAAIAFFSSFLVYSALRLLSHRFKMLARITAIPVILLAYLSLPSDTFYPYWTYVFWKPNFSAFLPFVFVFGMIGVLGHRKSCDEPTKFLPSLALMSATMTSGILTLLFLLRYDAFSLRGAYLNTFINTKPGIYVSSYAIFEQVTWIFVIFQTLAPPFLISGWKNSHLRPEIDKHR